MKELESRMKLRIICVGKMKEPFARKLILDYTKIIKKQNEIQIIEVPDEKTPDRASLVVENKILKIEGERILRHVQQNDYVIALCIEGEEVTTRKHQQLVKQQAIIGNKTVTYIIGGSLGLDTKVTARANFKLSFSRMTFPHQLMRVMLMEQLATICDMADD